jgi:hypothetical protein
LGVVVAEQYAGALLYLVPVLVAAVVAFVVTRPEKNATEQDAAERDLRAPGAVYRGAPVAGPADAAAFRPAAPVPPHVPAQRTYQPLNRRANPSTAAPVPPSPTLLHAALSSHLAAVAGGATSSSAPASSRQPVIRPSRLVSIRRPARIPRRPVHRCPHKP